MVGIYKTEIEQNKIEIDEELNYNTTKKLRRRTITTTIQSVRTKVETKDTDKEEIIPEA
jgi:hypothetical protein